MKGKVGGWAIAAVLGVALVGCGTLPGGRRWGEDVTLLPGWQRVRSAAVHAVTDPYTWAPAAGAAVVGLGGFDRRISDWARDHRPVFGTTRNAKRWSDDLSDAAGIGALASALATPSGEGPGEVVWNKAKGLAVEIAAVGTAMTTTVTLKGLTHRQRPDDSDHESFPSGHSTKAFAYATVGRRNLEALPLPQGLRSALGVGFDAVATATAWARVEAGKHYPSDVLAGAALANLLTGFVHDAFLGLDPGAGPTVAFEPVAGGLAVDLRIPF